jgi:hypothetical protein
VRGRRDAEKRSDRLGFPAARHAQVAAKVVAEGVVTAVAAVAIEVDVAPADRAELASSRQVRRSDPGASGGVHASKIGAAG